MGLGEDGTEYEIGSESGILWDWETVWDWE